MLAKVNSAFFGAHFLKHNKEGSVSACACECVRECMSLARLFSFLHAPLRRTATLRHLAAAVGWRWHNLGVTREKHVHTTLTLEPKHASQRLQCEPWRNGQPFPRGQRWRLLAEARPQPSTCKERHTRKGPTGRGMSPERYVAYPHAKRISPPRIEKNAFWLLPMWAGHKLELSKIAVAKHRLRRHDAHVANTCD